MTPIQLCHATRCQKTTGSAFAAEAGVFEEDFRWTAGEELLRHYQAPILREPPALVRAFCGVCGSPMPVRVEGRGFFVIMAGVLDEVPDDTKLFRQIFLGQAAGWWKPPQDLRGFEDRPPETERIPRKT